MKTLEYDLIVVGTGLVGSLLLQLLQKTNLKILALDANPKSVARSSDKRGIALSYRSIELLKELDLWSELSSHAWPISEIEVSAMRHFGAARLKPQNLHYSCLGACIDIGVLGQHLQQGLNVLAPRQVTRLSYCDRDQAWTCHTDYAECFSAKFIVAVDGSNSKLRQMLGIVAQSYDYKQQALVCNLVANIATKGLAMERFTKDGVLALLPFGKYSYKCIWSGDSNTAMQIQSLNKAEFISKIQTIAGWRLGRFVDSDPTQSFALQSLWVESNYDSRGAVLLGNAANTVHPVAAQGFNSALLDAYELAQALEFGTCLASFAKASSARHQLLRRYTKIMAESSMRIISLGILATAAIPCVSKVLTKRGCGIWN